jgi:hypothetical protein
MRRKISWTDGRTEVKQYTPPPPSGSGGIITPIKGEIIYILNIKGEIMYIYIYMSNTRGSGEPVSLT